MYGDDSGLILATQHLQEGGGEQVTNLIGWAGRGNEPIESWGCRTCHTSQGSPPSEGVPVIPECEDPDPEG